MRIAAVALLRFFLFVLAFRLMLPAVQLLVDSFVDGLLAAPLAMLITSVLLGLALLKLIDRRPASELGFPLRREALRDAALGLALGIAALTAGTLLLLLFGALRYAPQAGTFTGLLAGWFAMLGLLAIPAAAEEALFRGYGFQKLVQGLGPIAATLLASLGFAAAHGQNPNLNSVALANIFVAGIMLSAAFLWTRSLWFATGVHLGWNYGMAALFDLPVSGLELFDAPLYEPVDRGPAWLSGGAFGPEAGLAGLAALLLALAGVFWLTRKTRWLT